MSETKMGRPAALSHSDEWELYLCRVLGSSIRDCGRVFGVSIPTVNRVIAKFRFCHERVKLAVRKYREAMDVLRPKVSEPKRTRGRQWLLSMATPKWADRRAIRELYVESRRLTQETGVRHEVDHIYPILSPTICGLHVQTNLRIVTAAFNSAKSNRWEEVYE